MTPFPLNLVDLLGHWEAYTVYVLLGFGFGFALEMAGFGNSKKLAAQFYFSEMTVLKVMFTAIVVAMILIFWASALGLLDYNLIWVNPTYLVPGIVGGLIMGFGFIIGGFCPGTSLVATATRKLDGIFFSLGALFGIFLFGETVGFYNDFWHSTYEGRWTIPQLFGLEEGVVVLLVVVMAILAFGAGEFSEQIFGKMPIKDAPKWRYGAAGVATLSAVGLIFIGQPTTEDRWAMLEEDKAPLLEERAVQIHAGELLSTMHDDRLNLMMIDVRSESDYNQFHILDAKHIPSADIPDLIPELQDDPSNTVYVLMSNDEQTATEVWKMMVAESVPNVYILEGGVNQWIRTFAAEDLDEVTVLDDHPEDESAFLFTAALGARYPMSDPDPKEFQLEFTPKIKLENKRGASGGGCG